MKPFSLKKPCPTVCKYTQLIHLLVPTELFKVRPEWGLYFYSILCRDLEKGIIFQVVDLENSMFLGHERPGKFWNLFSKKM